MIKFRENSETAANHLRTAVPLMVERKIPPNPVNFALWYMYAAKRNASLDHALLEQFPDAASYTPEKSEELFYEYLVKPLIPEDDKSHQAVMQLISTLFTEVQKATQGTSDYGETLKASMKKLQNTRDPAEIQATLQNLLENTDQVSQLTDNFQQDLDAAKEEIQSLKHQLEASEKDAFIDSLTNIGNRRAFDSQLEEALGQKQQICLLLLDLDHFKRCNDTFGHLVGDKILGAVGKILSGYAKTDIHVARYGGEEFGVIMNGFSMDQAYTLAETIRVKVSKLRIKQKNSDTIDSITVSIGIADLIEGDNQQSLIERADGALYSAKESGRNQVCCDGLQKIG
jgi:diguanylate cyclase